MLEGSWRARVYVRVVWRSLENPSISAVCLHEDAKQRYESKVARTGLTVGPYVIDDWTQDPELGLFHGWRGVTCAVYGFHA